MKKEKLITRTIESTVVSYKVFVVSKGQVDSCVTTLTGRMNEKDCAKVLTAKYENNNDRKFIMVEAIFVEEKLYGMPESIFMTYATELPPRKTYEKGDE